MRVFSLVNCYNEAHNIHRCLDSIESVIPHPVTHVIVDGRYLDYPGKEKFSTDGTRAIAEARGVLLNSHNYECEKRNTGLRYIDTEAADGDFVLYLDADEELTSLFGWPDRVGSFNFTRKTRRPIVYGRCRLYRWEPGLHFHGRHYDLYDHAGTLVSSLEDAPDFQVVGTGNHWETWPRSEAKQTYYKRLRQREAPPAEAVNA